jgi:hypothetical protein
MGTITNHNVFQMYLMHTLFITFDSLIDNIFHCSHTNFFKWTLEDLIERNLKTKGLGIPLFVFTDLSNSNSITKFVENKKRDDVFANFFSGESLRQVSSATYKLQFNNKKEEKDFFVPFLNRGDYMPSEGIHIIFYTKSRSDCDPSKLCEAHLPY